MADSQAPGPPYWPHLDWIQFTLGGLGQVLSNFFPPEPEPEPHVTQSSEAVKAGVGLRLGLSE